MGDYISHTLDFFSNIGFEQFAQAVLTFSGMVFVVLGAFALIDSIRFPEKLVRTGKTHPAIYDQTIGAYGTPWEPVWQRASSRWFRGVMSALLEAGAFAIVVGIGYRRGEIGALVGASLGLGLGAAVAIRPIALWVARLPVLSQIVELLRNITWGVCFVGATAILLALEILFALVLFILVTVMWLVLLPWLIFAWLVRALRERPSHSGALVLPVVFLRALPSTFTRRGQTSNWRDPANYSLSARLTRWIVGQSSRLERFTLGVIIGVLCAFAGRSLVRAALGAQLASGLWFQLGALLVLGVVLERVFEFVVESLYHYDLTGFIDFGPQVLAGLRVGLLTELSLGSVVGLAASKSSLLHTTFDALQIITPASLSLALTTGAFTVMLLILPGILGWFATAITEWLNLRMHSIRVGSRIAGSLFFLIGTALQLLQFIAAVH